MATSLAHASSSLQVRPAANYNSFFHPNLCHVCKKASDNLIECLSCYMISYCSVQHLTLHETQHAQICNAIVTLRLFRDIRNFCGKTRIEWANFKNKNIENIRLLLKRDLQPYEKQMFLFPKSCFICYKQKNLPPPCQECSSINICREHDSRSIYHECTLLKQTCELDLDEICSGENRENRIFENCVKYNMIDYPDIKTFIRNNIEVGSICISQRSCDIIHLSDDLSAPLSLINITNENVAPLGEFVIHILIESPMDKRNVYAWELLLHQFYTISSLSIEAIGKELPVEAYTLQLCRDCTSMKRQIHYRSHNKTYYEYARSTMIFKFPKIIIVLNILTDMTDIIGLQHFFCPLLMLAYTKDRAEHNIAQMYEELSKHDEISSPWFLDPYIYKLNKFASVRPYRDYITGNVMFPSTYLILYKTIVGESIFIM
ncbi:uncharacterized protein LOC116846863 isoform X3 [Odontomachus brunneus]|nr:uncharacterized protein LOC116846863 isoform X3 [Odontomachus brunneus]